MKSEKNIKKIERSRSRIDDIDEKIIKLLSKRFHLCKTIGRLKKDEKIPVLQKQREERVLKNREKIAEQEGIDTQFIQKLFQAILKHSHKLQKRP